MLKKRNMIVALVFCFLATNFLSAKVSIEEAKKVTETFFSLSKKNDFKNSAKLLAYYGADKSRLYSDFYNPNNPDEFKEIKRICKKVNATLLISDSYTFGKFRDKTINGEELQTLEVQFLSGSQKIKRRILFIEINGSPAIYDYN